MSQPSLDSLGWNDWFQRGFDEFRTEGMVPARVTTQERGVYMLSMGDTDLTAELSGRFRHRVGERSALPTVGDWVLFTTTPGGGPAIVHDVLPRQTWLSRNAGRERFSMDPRQTGRIREEQMIAANVDEIFIVTSFTREFDRNRIDRFLTLVTQGGARPTVVVNKADLRDASEPLALDDLEPLFTSAVTESGLDELRARLMPRATYAFVGSSGVGKTSIVNRLLGDETYATLPTRDDDRGRHTTTRRQLVRLASGALLLDTPGLREIGMLDDDSVDETFDDIRAIADGCRFSDCRHNREPDCAVKEALETGSLDRKRFASYKKLQLEKEHVLTRNDQRSSTNKKAQWKAITKAMRGSKKG